MDDRTEVILTRIRFAVLAVIGGIALFDNFTYPWHVMILVGLLGLSFTIRNAILYSSRKKYVILISLLVDLVLVILINLADTGTTSLLFYFLLAADPSLIVSIRLSTWITFAAFLLQTIALTLKYINFSDKNFLTGIAVNLAVFLILYLAIHAVRYQIRQRQQLTETMTELKIKSGQLENAYMKLRETSEELEEITILKERNRIARDIHDTIGHTLTTILLEMEAAERLIPRSPERALEKTRFAKSQIRKGLQDIRTSVHTLKNGRELLSFRESVELLLDETAQSGAVFIHKDISELPKLTEVQEKVLYRAIQEGLTNGIRHGGSTAFVLQLQCENGYVKLMLSDNGCGIGKIVPGFGLGAMEERIKSIGGTLSISSQEGEGFYIGITIPLEKEQQNGE